MSVFIQVLPDLSKPEAPVMTIDGSDLKLVRSHAMKAYRHEQRTHYNEDGPSGPSSDDAWRQHRKRTRRMAKASSLQRQRPSKAKDKTWSNDDQTSHLATACILDMAKATPAYRVALVQNFCDGYFPVVAQETSGLASILDHWTSPASAAMETGNDALALLHLGGAVGDERISREGHRKYLLTLHMVRQDIEQDASHNSFEGLFAAAQDLLNCEIYRAVSSGFSGWAKHIAGITAIIKSSGFRQVSPVFNAFLSAQFRHTSLMYALVVRSQAPILRDLATMASESAEPGSIEQLTRLALTVPVLLEETDNLYAATRSDKSQENGLALFQKLTALEEGLISWERHFRKESVPDHRQSESPGIRSIGRQRPHFDHLALAFQRTLLLLACEARLMMQEGDGSSEVSSRVAANIYASDLMQYVPFLVASTGGDVSKAMAVRAPFHFALRWYRQSQNEKALAKWSYEENRYRDAFTYLDWDALLPFSFVALLWIG